MEKMKFETVDGTRRNVDKIAEMFPQVVTEVLGEDGKLKRAVKWDVLKELLSGDYVEGGECYEFTWPGKRAAIAEAAKPIRKTLRPCKEESKNWDTTENLYIEGDNLKALKLLQESYLGKVKMIYIDPPYNTGNDFVYKDNFTKDKDTSEEELGLFDEETDNRTMSGELFLNTESNGRFHSDWCSMMYPRLQIAKDLLADDGVIFISIDDNEQENLKKICDEIYGGKNYIAQIPWRKRTAKSDVPFGVSQDFEWIFAYAKTSLFMASIEGKERRYFETDDFPGRPWRIHDLTKQTTATERPNSFFTIINPKNGAEYPANPNRTWAITDDTFDDYYKANRIVFPGDYDFLSISRPALRYWKADDIAKAGDNFGRIAVSTKLNEDIGMSQDGTKELTAIFEGKIFPFPKPSKLIKFFISILNDPQAIILDFFSGSATSAHAVMQLNSEDGGKRKFIMIQVKEDCADGSDAAKAGYKNICEIGKERIRRAGKKILAECAARTNGGGNGDGSGECGGIPDLDIGFRVFKVADSNMKDVYYSASDYSQDMLDSLVSNIKEDRTDLDLLYGCLLEWGVELSLPHTSETIDNVAVHTVNNGDLIACFDANIPESAIRTIAKRQPLRAVFRDSSFSSAPQKINVEEIFKLLSPTTTVKVI